MAARQWGTASGKIRSPCTLLPAAEAVGAVAGNNNANLVWSIANILRGTYKPRQYGSVILPFTILRRLDCVLDATKDAVLAEQEVKKDLNIPLDTFLQKAAGHSFFNTSKFNFAKLLDDPTNIKANILNYVQGFSENTRDIFERFEFYKTLEKLDSSDCFTTSPRTSPRSTSTRRPSATSRWASCSRNSSAASPKPPTKPPVNTSPCAKSSSSWSSSC